MWNKQLLRNILGCCLVAGGHDAGHGLKVNLLGDVAGLDDLLLVGEGHQATRSQLPAVLVRPDLHRKDGVLSESLGQYVLEEREARKKFML